MLRQSLPSIVTRVCGVILVVAVALKVRGMTADSMGESLKVFSPRIQLIGLEVEALIGIWLLTGVARRGAWLAGLCLYTLLAATSLYLIAMAQPSCGCFGRVEVSPWASLGLDVACVAALMLTRPPSLLASMWADKSATARHLILTATAGAILLLLTSQSAGRAFARIRGESLRLGADADAGRADFGEVRLVTVVVENLGVTDFHLIGGTTSCACVATEDLPLTVPAGGVASVRVAIKYTGKPGNFKHTFYWNTDAPSQPILVGHVTGQIDSAPGHLAGVPAS